MSSNFTTDDEQRVATLESDNASIKSKVAKNESDILLFDKTNYLSDIATNFVADGLEATKSTTDMSIAFTKGPSARNRVYIDGKSVTLKDQTVIIEPADPSLPRIDLLVASTGGSILAIKGVAGSNHGNYSQVTDKMIVLYELTVPAGVTNLSTATLTDKRIWYGYGPVFPNDAKPGAFFHLTQTYGTYSPGSYYFDLSSSTWAKFLHSSDLSFIEHSNGLTIIDSSFAFNTQTSGTRSIGFNAYYDAASGLYRYIKTGGADVFQSSNDGSIGLWVAGSGSAGSSITWKNAFSVSNLGKVTMLDAAITGSLTGNATTATDLANGSILSVGKGGTGANSFTTNCLPYFDGTKFSSSDVIYSAGGLSLRSGKAIYLFNANNSSSAYWYNTGSSGYSRLTANVGGQDLMKITSSGVGIGIDYPSEKLHIAGNARIEGRIIQRETTTDSSRYTLYRGLNSFDREIISLCVEGVLEEPVYNATYDGSGSIYIRDDDLNVGVILRGIADDTNPNYFKGPIKCDNNVKVNGQIQQQAHDTNPYLFHKVTSSTGQDSMLFYVQGGAYAGSGTIYIEDGSGNHGTVLRGIADDTYPNYFKGPVKCDSYLRQQAPSSSNAYLFHKVTGSSGQDSMMFYVEGGAYDGAGSIYIYDGLGNRGVSLRGRADINYPNYFKGPIQCDSHIITTGQIQQSISTSDPYLFHKVTNSSGQNAMLFYVDGGSLAGAGSIHIGDGFGDYGVSLRGRPNNTYPNYFKGPVKINGQIQQQAPDTNVYLAHKVTSSTGNDSMLFYVEGGSFAGSGSIYIKDTSGNDGVALRGSANSTYPNYFKGPIKCDNNVTVNGTLYQQAPNTNGYMAHSVTSSTGQNAMFFYVESGSLLDSGAIYLCDGSGNYGTILRGKADNLYPNYFKGPIKCDSDINITGTYKINGVDVIGDIQAALDSINGEVI